MFQNIRWIDLSHEIHEGIPTLNASCGYSHKTIVDYDHHGIRIMKYSIHAGLGTHIDAPSHFKEGQGVNVEQIPLESTLGPLCVLDLSSRMHPDLMATAEDLYAFEKQHGPIQEGSFIALYSGWSKYWDTINKYRNADASGWMHFPGFDRSCIEFFLEKKVKGIGIDTISPDGACSEFPIHKAILGEHKIIIENLANLDQLPPTGSFFFAPPIPFKGGSESVTRAFAAKKIV